MTNKQLLIQLLNEATGEGTTLVAMKVDIMMGAMEEAKPGSTGDFYKQFTAEEAECILRLMRYRQAEIVNWFAWNFNCHTSRLLD